MYNTYRALKSFFDDGTVEYQMRMYIDFIAFSYIRTKTKYCTKKDEKKKFQITIHRIRIPTIPEKKINNV